MQIITLKFLLFMKYPFKIANPFPNKLLTKIINDHHLSSGYQSRPVNAVNSHADTETSAHAIT